MSRGFVEMARDDVMETMAEWQRFRKLANTSWSTGNELDDAALNTMIDKLVGSMIMLLRAVEEVEARPWWKPRRYNPYAR